jgi:hypothetical protein
MSLIDRKQNSSIFDVQSFRGTDSNNDHYLVVAKVRRTVRLSVSKQVAQKFNMEKFNLKKLNDMEISEQ